MQCITMQPVVSDYSIQPTAVRPIRRCIASIKSDKT